MPKTYTRKRKIFRKRRPTMFRRRKPQNKITKREKLFLKNPGSIVPDNYFAKLNAVDNSSIGVTGEAGPSTGYPNVHSYIGNTTQNVDVWRVAIGAPVIDANGHDQLSTLYNTERVHGSEITVNLVNLANDVYRCVVFPYLPNSNIGAFGTSQTTFTMDDLMEQPYAREGTLTSSNGVGKLVLKSYMSTKRIFGYKDISLNDDFSCQTALGVSSNVPNNEWYWGIAVQSMSGSTIPSQNVYYNVKLCYFTEFYDRIILSNGQDIGPTGI